MHLSNVSFFMQFFKYRNHVYEPDELLNSQNNLVNIFGSFGSDIFRFI